MDKKSFFLVIIFLAVGFFLINYTPRNFNLQNIENIKSVNIAGVNVAVELALSTETQMRGLGGRSILKENEGMLFVFKNPGKNYFWMKDMNFPIDIIWFDENMRVIYIQKNATPESYPESFGPDQNSKYVLEVISGFSDKNNLKIGDRATFTF